MIKIINQLNESNSTNHKLKVLKENINNENLKKLLKYTYDKSIFTFGIKKIPEYNKNLNNNEDLFKVLEEIENKLCSREITGNAAINFLIEKLESLNNDNQYILEKVIDRDLKINIDKKSINKIFKNLITSPKYMRCDKFSKSKIKNIKFPAYIQLKADGTFRMFEVKDGEVKCDSRSGESYIYSKLFERFKNLPDGYYIGELTVRATEENTKNLDEDVEIYNNILPRSLGNGLINSLDVPEDDIIIDLWDYLTHDDYDMITKTPYKNRFENLENILKEVNNINVIEYHIVNKIEEALEITSKWMDAGFEGGVLKDFKNFFKDGVSKEQVKLKVEADCDVRVVGFKPGTKGTKREGKVGALLYLTDDNKVQGSVSGFTDDLLDLFTNNPEVILNKVITARFNDMTKGKNNDYYALSHPRYIETRDDKNITDSYDDIVEIIKMAKELK